MLVLVGRGIDLDREKEEVAARTGRTTSAAIAGQ